MRIYIVCVCHMCRTRGDLHCDASSNSADNLWYEKDWWLRCGRSTGDQALLAGRGRLPKKKSILCRRWHGSRYLCTYLWLSGTPQFFYLENGPKFFHKTFRICRGSDCPHGIYNGKNCSTFRDAETEDAGFIDLRRFKGPLVVAQHRNAAVFQTPPKELFLGTKGRNMQSKRAAELENQKCLSKCRILPKTL